MAEGKMGKLIGASAAWLSVLALCISAAETPPKAETPKKSEVPKKAEETKKAETPRKDAAPDPALAAARADLERHIRVTMRENDANYPIQDDELIEMRYIEFKVVQSTPVARPSADRIILRAEFVERGDPEFGEKDVPILVDFGLRRDKKDWKVADKAIFSEDGEARFKYTEKFERAALNPPLRPETPDPGEKDLGEPGVPPRGDLEPAEERRGT